jgi:hypothetical protein
MFLAPGTPFRASTSSSFLEGMAKSYAPRFRSKRLVVSALSSPKCSSAAGSTDAVAAARGATDRLARVVVGSPPPPPPPPPPPCLAQPWPSPQARGGIAPHGYPQSARMRRCLLCVTNSLSSSFAARCWPLGGSSGAAPRPAWCSPGQAHMCPKSAHAAGRRWRSEPLC